MGLRRRQRVNGPATAVGFLTNVGLLLAQPEVQWLEAVLLGEGRAEVLGEVMAGIEFDVLDLRLGGRLEVGMQVGGHGPTIRLRRPRP